MTASLMERLLRAEGAIAIYAASAQYDYRQLYAEILVFEAHLENAGCCNRVVALVGDYSFTAVAALIALWRKGNVVALVTGRSAAEVDQLTTIAEANFVVRVDVTQAIAIEPRAPEVSHPLLLPLCASGEGGYIIFSSGSTGTPKASVHRLLPLLETHATPGRARRTISFLLFDHIGGLNTLVRTLMSGGALIFLSDRSPRTVSVAIQTYKAQALITSPTFLNLLVLGRADAADDLASLEVVNYGTEPMPKSTLAALQRLIPHARLSQSYGSTEAGVIPTRSESSASNLIRIVEEECDFRVVDGLLEVRPSTAMVGYLSGDNPFTTDGYFKTGDAVVQQGDYLYIIGRQSEIINVGGEKFYPAEVEQVLLEMSGILDVAVSKVKNSVVGNIVGATFRLKTMEPQDEFRRRLYEFCRGKMSPAKMPVKIDLTLEQLHSTRFKKIRNNESFIGN